MRASPPWGATRCFIRTRTHLYRIERRERSTAQSRMPPPSKSLYVAMAWVTSPGADPPPSPPPRGSARESAATRIRSRYNPSRLWRTAPTAHQPQVLHFYQAQCGTALRAVATATIPGDVPRDGGERRAAQSAEPTPLLFHIHGGGWVAGDKASVAQYLEKYLAAGISVVSINYRYVTQASGGREDRR